MRATQRALCADRLREMVPSETHKEEMTDLICPRPIGDWAATLQAHLVDEGLLLNRTTTTCPIAEATLAAAAAAWAAQVPKQPPSVAWPTWKVTSGRL